MLSEKEVTAKIPQLLDALRVVRLTPELQEVREQVELRAESRPATLSEEERHRLWSEFRFDPIRIKGEPLSHTIIQDREDRF